MAMIQKDFEALVEVPLPGKSYGSEPDKIRNRGSGKCIMVDGPPGKPTGRAVTQARKMLPYGRPPVEGARKALA
jgi:hypothetical protein